MDNFHHVYLLMNLGTLLSVCISSWAIKLNFIKHYSAILRVFLYVSSLFLLWDHFATKFGHWSFNPTYILGIKVYGLPIEEIAFFFTVPVACLFVYEVFIQKSKNITNTERKYPIYTLLIVLAAVTLLFFNLDKNYTRIAAISCLFTVTLLAWKSRKVPFIYSAKWWAYQAMIIGLFVCYNYVLTRLPVVMYSSSAITGIRISTIPIEDFFYNFTLINCSLVVYLIHKNKP